MPDYAVHYYDHLGESIVEYKPIEPVAVLKHNDPCTFTCEIALSDITTRDIIAPQATDFIFWRGATRIVEGEVWEVELSGERDTLVVEHRDYLNYLGNEKNGRIYPFHYPFTFGDWPKKWQAKDLTIIVEEIIQAAIDEDPFNTVPYVLGNSLTGISANYSIEAGDSTYILDHIKKLAEEEDGFDFWVRKLSDNIRFNMLAPKNDAGDIIYTFTADVGQIISDSFQWKNSGPESTWTLGLGSGTQSKFASESTFAPSSAQYRRRDTVVQYDVRNRDMLDRKTAAEGFRQRFPQKQCAFDFLVDTADLPNFWAGSLGRPHSLVGKRVHVGPILFRNYHLIDADFKILDITIKPDQDGNDWASFGLDMING